MNPIVASAGLAIVAGGLFGAGYMKGRSDGKIEQLADTVEAFQTRGKVDAIVRSKSDFDLCIAAGGVPDQCNQLRGMDATAEAE